MAFSRPLTSLGAYAPGLVIVGLEVPPKPSFRHEGDFGIQNIQADAYPPMRSVRSSAPSSVEINHKPFGSSGLSWLSFSSRGFIAPTPTLVKEPGSPVAR